MFRIDKNELRRNYGHNQRQTLRQHRANELGLNVAKTELLTFFRQFNQIRSNQ